VTKTINNLHVKLCTVHLAVLDIHEAEPNVYVITRINVPKAHRGEGVGRTLLTEICRDADELKVTLKLEINPYGEMTHDELAAWYERYGFIHDGKGTWWRKPK
jgi:predicted GNAT family N-acyltransferase